MHDVLVPLLQSFRSGAGHVPPMRRSRARAFRIWSSSVGPVPNSANSSSFRALLIADALIETVIAEPPHMYTLKMLTLLSAAERCDRQPPLHQEPMECTLCGWLLWHRPGGA